MKHIARLMILSLSICFSWTTIAEEDIANQAWELVEQGTLLIDVRSEEEFAEGHLSGAINIPHTELAQLMEAIGSDFNRPVVVYCRSGNRSGKAKTSLEEQGYSAVFNGTGFEYLKENKPE